MTGQNAPYHHIQPPHELTPRDDAKKIVSEVLKRADQLIRKGELDLAQMEVARAKDIDPRNVYAFALEERIGFLRKDIETIKTSSRGVNLPQIPAPEKTVEEKKIQQTLKEPAFYPIVQEEIPEETTMPITPSSSSDPSSLARKFYEPQQEQVIDRSIELETYRKALTEAWSDGALSEDEDRQLKELQLLLEITAEEHEGIERNIKRDCYKNAIVRQIANNPIALSDSKTLDELKQTYNISDDEHMQIQMQLLDHIQRRKRNKILVIDDDTRLLELLATSLEDNGFDVTPLSTSDEAYALLRKFVPDLILCDINLETSTMGGFTFYEKVQELKNLQSTPFIFLTGLTDEALVRTGKELGVDDYLIKPISERTLVSTLRGKLKRFKQLKGIAVSQTLPIAIA